MEEVLEKCIKPFLLGKSDDQLYLVKLGKEKIDYEQHLRIQAEKERKKRDKIAKQYADNLILAMGPAERAYQDYFGFTETLTQEYRKSGEVRFSDDYLSKHLIDFFYKMKVFEFEIAPEQVRDFLKECLQAEHLSSAQESWIRGILTNCLHPFLNRLLI